MIRLTPQRKYHVSNRLAFVAALVLAVSSYIGFSHGAGSDHDYSGHKAVAESQQERQDIDTGAQANNSVKKRKPKISLVLFSRG